MLWTNAAILSSVRELSFDRFVTPSFFIAQTAKLLWTWEVETDPTSKLPITITILDDSPTPQEKLVVDLTQVLTMDTLVRTIIAADLPLDIVYSGSFIGTEPSNSIFPGKMTLELYKPIFRSYYFSDTYIQNYFRRYGQEVLNRHDREVNAIITDADWDGEFADPEFNNYRQGHFTLWVAYQLVGDRRLYELAAQTLLLSSSGGNPNEAIGVAAVTNNNFTFTSPGDDITMQVADVFTLTEDRNTMMGVDNAGEIPKDMVAPWGVGSDNTLMDYYSFWYRLQLWVRDQLEQRTGDYSLRKNTIMTGQLSIDPRDSNKFFSYFDSYPWVFSPYLRGVPYGSLQNLRT